MSALQINNLSVGYGSRQILRGVSLTVEPGQITALVGPNGAGKSTLIRAVSGVIPVAGGQVLVDGRSILPLSTMDRARQIAVVPQSRTLPPAFTIYETVMLGRTPYLGWLGRPSRRDCEIVAHALQQTGLADFSDRFVGQLSGGEEQQVLFARALAQDTPILLLDEPNTHLDLRHQEHTTRLIREAALARKQAVLMVLHDLSLAGLYADQVVLLVDGAVQAAGTPGDVLTEENLSRVYQMPVRVIRHPDHGSPLVLPNGRSVHK